VDAFSVSVQVVAALRASSSSETRLADGSTARRVGRNPVWHVTAVDGRSAYVKLCRDDADFARQVFGLRVAGRMAAADARFMAAEIVTADAASHLLVTRPIGGIGVRDLFANGFRRDRNPLGRAPARAGSLEALRMVAAWLAAIHAQPVDATVPLYDHSRAAVWQRAARKLDALAHTTPLLSAHVGFSSRWRLVAPPADEGLVYGDATLVNFFVAGGRVGAVDFEDVGRGAAARDWTTLEDDVARAFGHLHYRSDREALAQVSFPPDVTRELVLLELAVNRFEHALTLEGLAAAYGRRRYRARLARLVDTLAAAGAIEPRTS
jgi:hypothetical protein